MWPFSSSSLFAQAADGPIEQVTGGTRETIDTLARTPISKIVIFAVVLTIVRFAIWPYLKKTPIHLRGFGFQIARFFSDSIDAVVYAAVFVFLVIRPFGVQAFTIPSGSMWPTLYVNDYIVANKFIYRYTDPKAGDIVVFRPPSHAPPRTSMYFYADGEVKADYIKRCIGTPGDLIEVKAGTLYRNGEVWRPEVKHLSECTDPNQFRGNPCETYKELSDEEKKSMSQANFKLVMRNGEVIPLNYSDLDANSASPAHADYGSNPKYTLTDPVEMKELSAAPAVKIPAGMYLMVGDNRNNSNDGRAWGLVSRSDIVGRCEATWLPLNRMGRPK